MLSLLLFLNAGSMNRMSQAVKAKRLPDMLQLLAGRGANGAMEQVNDLDNSPRASLRRLLCGRDFVSCLQTVGRLLLLLWSRQWQIRVEGIDCDLPRTVSLPFPHLDVLPFVKFGLASYQSTEKLKHMRQTFILPMRIFNAVHPPPRTAASGASCANHHQSSIA